VTRPTSAKVREAIFNILGPPPAAPILDLFAGTGALGIEALSRGAERACFVERDTRALAALGRNLRELGLADRSTIMGGNVRAALDRLAGGTDRFAWVFVDPPYAAGEAEGVLATLGSDTLLAQCAVVIVEHDKKHLPPERAGSLHMVDRRFYGDTGVSFYRQNLSLA
jgi:16S rRNA (guanine966-N2)-methyltransferase